MKVTIVPIVIGASGTITKGLLKGLEDLKVGGRVKTIQTTALLWTARILRRVLETWGDLLSLSPSEKPSACANVKNSIQKEYLWRTRKLLETKLYSRNLIKGINTWAVPLVRYSGRFLKWTRDELKQMDQRTRIMTVHKALHPRDDVDRLYVSRKEGGRVLASIEDSIDASIQQLEDYIENTNEDWLQPSEIILTKR